MSFHVDRATQETVLVLNRLIKNRNSEVRLLMKLGQLNQVVTLDSVYLRGLSHPSAAPHTSAHLFCSLAQFCISRFVELPAHPNFKTKDVVAKTLVFWYQGSAQESCLDQDMLFF